MLAICRLAAGASRPAFAHFCRAKITQLAERHATIEQFFFTWRKDFPPRPLFCHPKVSVVSLASARNGILKTSPHSTRFVGCVRFYFLSQNKQSSRRRTPVISVHLLLDSGVRRGDAPRPYFFIASSIETATATVQPTIGLLPIPIKPIISTWAGTDDEPAN